MPNRSDPDSYLPLHPLELRILIAVREGPLHGYRIVKELEARSSLRPVHPANLYRRIRALLAQGLLCEVDAPTEPEDGRQRKFFDATPLGRSVAQAEVRRLQALLAEAEPLVT